jgi:hypothetical protein
MPGPAPVAAGGVEGDFVKPNIQRHFHSADLDKEGFNTLLNGIEDIGWHGRDRQQDEVTFFDAHHSLIHNQR